MTDATPEPIQVPPDSPPDPPHACATARDIVPLDTIRRDVQELSDSDKLDKETALRMMRLFHSMDLLLTHEINARDASLASLRHELQEQRLRVELDRIATRQIQGDAMMASTPLPVARMSKRMSR